MSERVMLVDDRCCDCICNDAVDEGVLISAFMNGSEEGQVTLSYSAALLLGEWLIERANQAGER